MFRPGSVIVEGFGNVLAASSFLQGLAAEELSQEELDQRDSAHEVTITVLDWRQLSHTLLQAVVYLTGLLPLG